MILKGNARSGAKDLADHLMNADSNERVELAEVRGFVASDLDGAFREAEAIASGTNCEKFLYSLSINPSQPMSREQYAAAVDKIESALGLDDQPRAIVFHKKEGREHAHVVWSRIDGETLKACPLPFDRQKLREVSRSLAVEYGHTLPEGLAKDKGAERFKDQFKLVSLAEQGQYERSGISPAERKAEITTAYQQSDNARSFQAALGELGYSLAQGDKTDSKGRAVPVVVDKAGEVYGLRQQIEGARARVLRDFLTLDLPTIQQAKEQNAAQQRQNVEKHDLSSVETLSPHEREKHHQARLEALTDAQRAEIKAMRGAFSDGLAAINEKEKKRSEAIKEEVSAAYKDEWRDLFKAQREEVRTFKLETSTIARRFQAFATGRAGHFFENSGSLAGTFQFVMQGQTDLAKLEKRHQLERRGLGDMQRLAEREELKVNRDEAKQARKEAREIHKQEMTDLQLEHIKERQILDKELRGERDGGHTHPRRRSLNQLFDQTATEEQKQAAKQFEEEAKKLSKERGNSNDLGRTR